VKGLIVSNGNINNHHILKDIAMNVDFIICADGGIQHLINIDVIPDLVIGDLDSINQDGLDFIRDKDIPVNKFPAIKDKTDTDLAVEYFIDKSYNEIIFMGVTGTRLDHTLSNILLLNNLHGIGIKAKIIDDNNIIQLVDDYLELKYLEGHYVSLIPLTEEGIVVTLKGFFYNLDSETMEFGSTFGISNKIVDDFGSIKIHSGKSLVFLSRD